MTKPGGPAARLSCMSRLNGTHYPLANGYTHRDLRSDAYNPRAARNSCEAGRLQGEMKSVPAPSPIATATPYMRETDRFGMAFAWLAIALVVGTLVVFFTPGIRIA